MINITDKTNCCACTACSQICPQQCITMEVDWEGFKYPHVDTDLCVNCRLCEKVCPYLHPYPVPKEKPTSFACKTKDADLRENSSSGGLFTVLASKIIHEGGVVFGARFDDNWRVIHDYTETEDGLAVFRGSKYVQSDICNSFSQVKKFLKDGRKVLFCGTPCQVAGLSHFLEKKYDDLLMVDFVCHCVPSPKVWEKYLQELSKDCKIVSISFRDKSQGWAEFGLAISGEIQSAVSNQCVVLTKSSHHENLYMKAFLSNLIVRPGCTNCPARHYTSGADVTIADCWGINEYHPDLNDNLGMSLALLHTDKGKALYQDVLSQLDSLQIPYEEVQEESNHSPIIKAPRCHPYRDQFFSEFRKSKKSTITLLEKYVRKGERRKEHIFMAKKIIRGILGKKIVDKLKRR